MGMIDRLLNTAPWGSTSTTAAAGAPAAVPRRAQFDRIVDALNRVPRPLLALGAVATLAYGMADPEGFAARMDGLEQAPEPLWWLLGGVVSFFFGAREAHHFRLRRGMTTSAAGTDMVPPPVARTEADGAGGFLPQSDNPALAEWRAAKRD